MQTCVDSEHKVFEAFVEYQTSPRKNRPLSRVRIQIESPIILSDRSIHEILRQAIRHGELRGEYRKSVCNLLEVDSD